jgi:hypothetical protein
MPAEFYLIWSREHGRWWGPGSWGYTDDFEKAGHYTREQADAIVERGNFVGLNEAIVPVFEHTLSGERANRAKQER